MLSVGGARLSVLDLSQVGPGQTPADALRDTVTLAQRADALGYQRFWVAEHHNVSGLASTAPTVMIGQIAARTQRIRVGSGGVMLPNHSPLVVAEQFGVLEALHPGRIDLGLGKANSTDPVLAAALRRPAEVDFPAGLGQLLSYFEVSNDRVQAVTAPGNRPAVWILATGPDSGRFAGEQGLPLAYAHFLDAGQLEATARSYRDNFRPSVQLQQPYLAVAVSAICALTAAEAIAVARPGRLLVAQMLRGQTAALMSRAEAASRELSAAEEALVDQRIGHHFAGMWRAVRADLAALVAAVAADEILVTATIADSADRIRSFELLADRL